MIAFDFDIVEDIIGNKGEGPQWTVIQFETYVKLIVNYKLVTK